MDTTLLVYLNDVWNRLDIYEDIPITLMIQEVDSNPLDGRKSPYSKQFQIPNTTTNANILEHYFEVNGVDFNPLQKINCVVQYRGTDIFVGYMRLSAVINYPNYVDYEVYILGDVADFASEIRNITLQDLSWDDLQHELCYSSITTSWSADTTDTNGLFGGKILYPMINYGLLYPSGDTPSWTYSFGEARSFDSSAHPVPESVWKPAVRVKEVINRIFAKTGYAIQSEFFDTDYFHSIYMDTFVNGKLGVEVASAVTNQNIFKIYANDSVLYTNPDGRYQMLFDDFLPNGYDPLNNFTPAVPYNSIDPGNQPGRSNFKAPFGGQYSFNIRFNFDNNNSGNRPIYFQIVLLKSRNADGSNPTTIAVSEQLQSREDTKSVNWLPTVLLDPGDYVTAFISVTENLSRNDLRITGYDSFGLSSPAPMWELYNAPTLSGTQIVDIGLGLPATNCIDYLKGLITMFNLVIVQDEVNRTIIIEPFNWYYNEPDRAEVDWTDRQDLNSTWRLEPLSFELAKILNFTYEKGSEEYLNKLFEDTNQYNFGRYKYTSTSNLFTSQQDYTTPFAALPTTVVNGADNFIIPAVYRELIPQLQPYSNKSHIFFWVGNRYAYTDKFKQIQGTWYLSSGSTQIAQTTYPCVSHLSSLDIQIPDLVSDLNFGSTWDFFGNYNNLPVQFTPYNLYNLYWEDYVENIYSTQTRRLTAKFLLRPLDIYQLKLTDKVFVKDSFYRIEKINEADLVNNKITECSLIKELGGYYKVIPPAPYYTISPNQPYPGISTAYQIVCYTGTTISPVCLGTSSTQTLTTFGVSGLSTNQQVYYDTGTEYRPVSQGTYVRYTGETDTYVVINSVGTLLQQNC
jgi:hypothetical protein